MEQKFAKFEDLEVKINASKGTFEGYASVFGGVDSYGDTIIPGAYKATLLNRTKPVSMYFNHVKYRADMPARIGNYTHLEEDSKGLAFAGKLTPGHPTAEACKASMSDGTLTGTSIGYRVPEKGSVMKNGVRELHIIDLYEISLVDDPADAAALIDSSSIKSMLKELKNKTDIENFLRDVGQFSKAAAQAFMSQYQSVILREADEDGVKKEGLLHVLQDFNSKSTSFIHLGVPDHEQRS